MALARVVGALGRTGLPGEESGERAVQPDPLARQQIGVDGLAGQGVPEGVRAVLARDQQLSSDGLAQRRLQGVLRQLYRVVQQFVLDAPPGDRGRAQHLLGGVGQLLDADEEYVGEAARHDGGGRVDVTGQRGEQLLRVEGVPLGAFDDTADGGVGEGLGPQGAHQAGHFGVSQRAQFETVHGGQPDQFGEQGAQGVAAVQVVRAVGGEDGQPVGRGTGRRVLQEAAAEEEAEEVAGGLVGPVEVFEDQEEGVMSATAASRAATPSKRRRRLPVSVVPSGVPVPVPAPVPLPVPSSRPTAGWAANAAANRSSAASMPRISVNGR